MRYVTITKSRFYNNAVGIVPNALDSEKFPPAEDNIIIDNDIFWNNFNFHQGKPPFTVREDGTAALVPMGTGILLFGGRGNRVENNRIYGNYLGGVAAIDGILLAKNPQAVSLDRNVDPGQHVRRRRHRRQRPRHQLRRQRQRQLLLAGRRRLDVPRRSLDVHGCSGKNAFSQDARNQLLLWTGSGALTGWVKHPHAAKAGYKPLEDFE